MSTFIDEYGLVPYRPMTNRKMYPLPKYCEISGCEETRRIPGAYGLPGIHSTQYVYDHCHVHGWIRGMVCNSCNGKLRGIDAGKQPQDIYYSVRTWLGFAHPKNAIAHPENVLLSVEHREQLSQWLAIAGEAYIQHINKCPDCVSGGLSDTPADQ